MKSLDLSNVSLDGWKLVESSAGTGKTYAIASLYVRLLLERRLGVGQILVVTFTEAATEDLKRRIRVRIREAMDTLATGKGEDEFLDGLLRKTANPTEAHRVLADALRTFDEAAIFTIHAFCQRVLQENAFESGSPFETDFVTNQESFLREIVDDFWRIELYPASALFIRHAWRDGLTPESLLQFVKQCASWPLLEVIPEGQKACAEVQARLEEAVWQEHRTLRTAWESSKAAVGAILFRDVGLNRSIYRLETIERDLRDLEAYLSAGDPLNLPAGFEKFCSSKLVRSVKRNQAAPRPCLFDRCEEFLGTCKELRGLFDRSLLALKARLVHFARNELRARKRERNLRSYDDLLLDLHEVLSGPGRSGLAASLGQRYAAALVDEFQDTDPLQYAIFQKLFSGGETGVFLIGDPKQAIYSFRGADVFAYMQAAREIETRLTLDRNWRSTEKLVQAVNRIFQNVPHPFLFPEIEFRAVRAASGSDGFVWRGESSPEPLKIWAMERTQPDQPINKSQAYEELPAAAASEIVRWLQAGNAGEALVENKPLTAHHIAVLVRTNDEARRMQTALQRVNVPSVIHSDESVFKSPEALDLLRVLAAVAEPGNEGRIRAALATEIFGATSGELAELAEDEARSDFWLETFAFYRDLWIDQGFMTMATCLIARQEVRARLLGLPGGERRLTNLLHCCELLHQAALENGLGVEELLKWLAETRQQSSVARVEEHQIRLETDEQAVQIVTVHKSKGLQYPIVFCPFCWNTGAKRDEVLFHDPEKPGTLVMDIGSPQLEAHRELAEAEDLAENARLLYVALTRAKYRCVVAWGGIRDAGASALAYLLHPPPALKAGALGSRSNGLDSEGKSPGEPLKHRNSPSDGSSPGSPAHFLRGFDGNTVKELKSHFNGLRSDAIDRDLQSLAGDGHSGIAWSRMPKPSAAAYVSPVQQMAELSCRRLTREIPSGWSLASFSSLVAGKARETELQDRDSVGSRSGEETEPHLPARARTFVDFPRGRRAGTALHELFEAIDFSLEPMEPVRTVVRETLAKFGFESAWQEPVLQMLRDVLTTPLDPEAANFCLSSLPPERRLHELEFTFPLDLLTSRRLRAAFAVHRSIDFPKALPQALELLDFVPVQGAMKGFIDLVFEREGRFYLADWKSNFLGQGPEAYGRRALDDVMMGELYVLQYHLYVVALDRYLAFRLREYEYQTHFGGVYYLFLRGIGPQHGPAYGVFRDRPPEPLIRELSRCLHAGKAR